MTRLSDADLRILTSPNPASGQDFLRDSFGNVITDSDGTPMTVAA